MTTRDSSLTEFMFSYGHGVPDQVWAKILPRSVFTFLLTKLPQEAAETAKSEIRDSIGALFQISLLEILTEAWKKYELVTKAMEESRRKPNDTIIKALTKHTVKSTHHPYVEVTIENKSVGKIEFELTAAFEVEGLNLRIQNGTISEILAGSCQGSIYLAFANESLMEVKTQRISLPGSIAVKSDNALMESSSTQPTLRKVEHDKS